MQTPEFVGALEKLITLARPASTAVACTEAVPWRRPRSLIADALVIRGVEVLHLVGPGSIHPHTPTPFARIDGVTLTYPDPEALR